MSEHVKKLPEQSHAIPVRKPDAAAPAPERAAKPLAPSAILQRAALAPQSLRPADIQRLQQTIGNRAVGALLRQLVAPARPLVQAKLTVNTPGDAFEQEADRIAEAVMRPPAAHNTPGEAETPAVTRLPQPSPAAGGAFPAGDAFEEGLQAARGQGQPLLPALKENFEAKFGADFGRVRIHADARSDRLNRSIQAQAFTTGRDVFFRQGVYDPASRSGQTVIAHELTHVLQQGSDNEFPENRCYDGRNEQHKGITSERRANRDHLTKNMLAKGTLFPTLSLGIKGSLSETGNIPKRSSCAHPSLLGDRATPAIQRKRSPSEADWKGYLPPGVTIDKLKERVATNYNDSERRGQNIKKLYENWQIKNTQDTKTTHRFKSKGYVTTTSTLGTRVDLETSRTQNKLLTLKGSDSVEAQSALDKKDTSKIKAILGRVQITTHGGIQITKKEGKREAGVKEDRKEVDYKDWEIRTTGLSKETRKLGSFDQYGRTYVAKFNNDDSSVTFYSLERVATPLSPYANRYSKHEKTFTASWNYKENEDEQTFAEPNSEVIWNQYKTAIKAISQNKKEYFHNLNQIIRQAVVNTQTNDTIFLCDQGDVLQKGDSRKVTPDSQDFWALIGTPNGTAAGHLLIDHGRALGLDAYESIMITKSDLIIKYRLTGGTGQDASKKGSIPEEKESVPRQEFVFDDATLFEEGARLSEDEFVFDDASLSGEEF